MVITVTSYGTKLRRNGRRIAVEGKEGQRQEFPVCEVDGLVLSVPCGLTSELLTLCAEEDVPVTMLGRNGSPIWRVEPFAAGGSALLRRRQLTLADRPEGLVLVKGLLSDKLDARIRVLRRLAARRTGERSGALLRAADEMERIREKIRGVEAASVNECRGTLQGWEGNAGRVYFSAIAGLIPEAGGFTRRGRGAEAGRFNQMLNYACGVLYRELTDLCRLAGLDPCIGVMHTDVPGRPSLVCDLTEPFRGEIEAAVCGLFVRRRVRAEHFEEDRLSAQGKRLLMEALEKTLGGKDGLRKGMERRVASLAASLRGEGKEDEAKCIAG